jgi:PIN domain nuclease of toxin-antitoxin system
MRVLLDTHVFLWWIMDSPMLPEAARAVIGDGDNELFLSAASGWEIAIKSQLGRLQLQGPPQEFVAEQLAQNRIHSLPILMAHALHVFGLPWHHRDPFDRLLVAQSQLENLPLLTFDEDIAGYDVQLIAHEL